MGVKRRFDLQGYAACPVRRLQRAGRARMKRMLSERPRRGGPRMGLKRSFTRLVAGTDSKIRCLLRGGYGHHISLRPGAF